MNSKFLNLLDTLRIVLVCATFYIGYSIGFSGAEYNAVAQLHFMIPAIIVIIAGLSGAEGLILGDATARNKGYETGSNYQIQSSIALLSYAVTALIILLTGWGIKAELTIFFAFMFFFIFSGFNHLRDAVKHKNYKWQNINRPFITLMLVAGMIYPVIKVLQAK
jgi:hypothetical protein